MTAPACVAPDFGQRAHGGLVHRMWKLRTTKGSFAIKQLNHERMDAKVQDRYRGSQQIAAAFAASGLPAVAALDARSSGAH